MPEQPHQKAEEALQRYAKERRASGGDFPLHPATRRALHAEVTREFGAGQKRRGVSGWFSAWQMPAFSGAFVVMLAFGVWIFSKKSGDISETNSLAKLSTTEAIPAPEMAQTARESKRFLKNSMRPAEDEAKPILIAPAPASGPSDGIASKMETDKMMVAKKDAAPVMNTPALPDSRTVSRNAEASSSIAASPAPSADLMYKSKPGPGANYSVNADAQNGLAANNVQQQIVANLDASKQNTSSAAGAYQLRLTDAFDAPNSTAPMQNQQLDAASRQKDALAENVLAANADARRASISQQETTVNYFYSQQQTTTPAIAPAAPALAGAAGSAQPQPTFSRQRNDWVQADSASALSANGERGADSVLSEFNLEQRGDAVQVTDADGSVYVGTFLAQSAEPVAEAIGGSKQLEVSTAAKPGSASARGRNFRVSGTNLTLNQLIVVSGRVSSVTTTQSAFRFIDSSAAAQARNRETALQRVSPATAAPMISRRAGELSETDANGTNYPPSVEGTIRSGRGERSFRALPVPR